MAAAYGVRMHEDGDVLLVDTSSGMIEGRFTPSCIEGKILSVFPAGGTNVTVNYENACYTYDATTGMRV